MKQAQTWTPGQGPGAVLAAIAANGSVTRPALEETTGLSRPTISDRVRRLIEAGFVRETSRRLSSGGRPAVALELNPLAWVSLCVDIGEERARVAVADATAEVLVESVMEVRIADGPRAVLAAIAAMGRTLLEDPAVNDVSLGGIGIGLPAPVDFHSGRTIGWSIMPGWDGYAVRENLAEEFGVPVFVDNDVNLLVLAEHRLHWPDLDHLFFLKAGTGIGSGLIIDGEINRGNLGAAGDIGHTHLAGRRDPQCRCGNHGCLEAIVGGWALARDLRRHGKAFDDVTDARDVVAAVRRGDPPAMGVIRTAGRALGESVAYATSLLHPAVIVIGGELAKAGDVLVASIREIVYQRSLPLATKDLVIALSTLDDSGGVIGAARLVSEQLLDPSRIDAVLEMAAPSRRRG